ncbi:MAG: hypothetical protein OXQ28_05730 [Acidobacteriota bacterium]|nr:hypothetical protein [Acidobacteriota bacterium]
MSRFMTCHETGHPAPAADPHREVTKVESQDPARAIFSPRTITLESGERVKVIEPPYGRPIDAGAEQVERRDVPHAVGMEALGAQRRRRRLGAGAVILSRR